MPRTRDVVALSAILIAPLAVTLALALQPGEDPVGAASTASAPIETPASEPPTPETPASEPPSAPTPAPTVSAPTRDSGQIILLRDQDLVLHSHPELAWSSGEVSVVARTGELIVSQSVDPGALPEPIRALAGAMVTIYGDDGSACVAEIGPMRAEHLQTGEVYMDMAPEDDHDFDTLDPPKDRVALRKHAEERFRGDNVRLLLARQENRAGEACQGIWARRADLPAPAVFGRRELSEADQEELVRRALEVVRAQPEFPAVEADYARRVAEYGADSGLAPWPEFVAQNFRAVRWDEVGGPRRIVSIELAELPEGCGDFFESKIHLLLEQEGDALVRLPQASWPSIAALMDLDRDGVLEAVTHFDLVHEVVAAGPTAEAFIDKYWDDYVGCRC